MHSWCPSTSVLMPPRHSSSGNSLSTCGGGFSSTPGYVTTRIPHALLPEKVFSTTRSLRPAASVIPVPSSPGALDDLGDAALLLLTIRLWIITQQMSLRCAPGGGLGLAFPFGHRPSWGAGASSLFWLVVATPSWLLSN